MLSLILGLIAFEEEHKRWKGTEKKHGEGGVGGGVGVGHRDRGIAGIKVQERRKV